MFFRNRVLRKTIRCAVCSPVVKFHIFLPLYFGTKQAIKELKADRLYNRTLLVFTSAHINQKCKYSYFWLSPLYFEIKKENYKVNNNN
jgi:hypothetical protein